MALVNGIAHDWTGFAKGVSGYVVTISALQYQVSCEPWKVFDGGTAYPHYWIRNATSGWIKIEFSPGIDIEQIDLQANTQPEPLRMPKNFTIQGSNNDSDWTTLYTSGDEEDWGSGEWREFTLSSHGTYKYYLIDITVNNGDASNTVIAGVNIWAQESEFPAISDVTDHDWTGTTNTVGGYLMTISESSYFNIYAGWKACQGLIGNPYFWIANAASGWWKIDLGEDNALDVIKMHLQANSNNEPLRMPKNFTIEGSNNDSDWDVLYTSGDEESWGNGEVRQFILTAPDSYRYYKVAFTTNNGDALYSVLGEVYLWISEVVAGWTGKVLGVDSANIAKVCGVAIADIAKVGGV